LLIIRFFGAAAVALCRSSIALASLLWRSSAAESALLLKKFLFLVGSASSASSFALFASLRRLTKTASPF